MDEDAITTEVADEGVSDDVDAGSFDEGVDETSETSVDEGLPEDTPDAWEALKGKGYDPAKLEKSFTRFTSELEGVKSQAAELEPYRQLKEAIESDPKVYAALEKALADVDSETDVDSLKREVTGLKQQMATEREVEALRAYATAEGLPEVDDKAIVQHAIKNGIGNLKSAYHDLHFDAIRAAERENTLAEVKKNKGASAVTSTASSKKAAPAFTKEQIAGMTSKEVEDNYPAILEFYKNGK
jgi:hypothetical protein